MRRILKWLGIVLGVLLALVIGAGVWVYFHSEAAMNRRYEVPVEAIDVPTDAESIANGRRLVYTRSCVECHGEDLGGSVMIDDPALGRITASNLTTGEGGVGAHYTDADWVRAIRHGVAPDGAGLLIMPAAEYNGLSADDLGDLLAYLKSAAPVDNPLPDDQLGPVGRILVASGTVPIMSADAIDHSQPIPQDVVVEVSVEYGAYLAASCMGCHGVGLAGGPLPGAGPDELPAANLTPARLGGWTEQDFIRAMREGLRPDGSAIDASMPWQSLGPHMTDDELRALWLYLQSIPSAESAAN